MAYVYKTDQFVAEIKVNNVWNLYKDANGAVIVKDNPTDLVNELKAQYGNDNYKIFNEMEVTKTDVVVTTP